MPQSDPYVTPLRRLAGELPVHELTATEAAARAALRWVVEPALAATAHPNVIPADPATCPNCGKSAPSLRSPYCSAECREIAAFVRQFRAGLLNGNAFDHERQIAMGQNLWHLLGGGRPLRIQLVPERTKAQILRRDGARCQLCGNPATEVDHVRTGCNRAINLRAVCANCTTARPFGDPGVITRPHAQELLQEASRRIRARSATRCCDDEASWVWQEYVAARRNPTPQSTPN